MGIVHTESLPFPIHSASSTMSIPSRRTSTPMSPSPVHASVSPGMQSFSLAPYRLPSAVGLISGSGSSVRVVSSWVMLSRSSALYSTRDYRAELCLSYWHIGLCAHNHEARSYHIDHDGDDGFPIRNGDDAAERDVQLDTISVELRY